VNLSAIQLKSRGLMQAVMGALAASGLGPQRLELEITESVLLNDSEATRAILRQLHDLGVRIALDDFGTGYSSLSYLRSFPFDKIKIDRCFIADLSNDSHHARAILRAVVQLGNSLGMTTTAEGVETKEQLSIVRQEGCTEVQGYIFSASKGAAELRRSYFADHAQQAEPARVADNVPHLAGFPAPEGRPRGTAPVPRNAVAGS
jgi:EAL domain-containing protein (putative c-di-GMP-specific phosphodiesterase class I)